ncbi:murein biosynthesis integral membrane protein MurJ [Sphingomonas gilva]|uniref:Probable lipid II flippase MurJ n=1 Tax=Sphingomonas gilva TaxID=2305907 RepID=A0A396RYW7_9SPHN|nr:murein biosynthesis integral membrane protein MurJ [Sphingomonas gilva]RHW16295.1 murein biosynthesis integral membrane protein MurJ [Sphingomonas gilva]
MNLLKSTGTIGGLTLVSRVFGFVRDILLARVLGAGVAADAYQLAFRLPNTFRRLFAEGAFSVAYVPMFSRKLHGEGGLPEAENFSRDVLSVFVPILLGFTALFLLIMPWFVLALASEFREVPGKFELAVELSRYAFPYLFFISLVSLLTGILNSMSRFGPGASAPILFNLTLISGILLGGYLRPPGGGDVIVVQVLAAFVSLSGLVQLIWLWWFVRREGISLKLRRPRFTGDVRELGRIILPATFGAGIYQVSQFIDTFFATRLPTGTLTHLAMADRLNQMPLGVIGIALGTAILPALSRHIVQNDESGARGLQGQAIELAMLLTLPAAAALAVCAGPLVDGFFVGGRFTPEDGRVTAAVLQMIVVGLPAYVLVKILIPGFFARKDTRTPVWTALAALIVNVILIVLLIGRYGIIGLVAAGAAAAWFNTFLLYAILSRRGHYRLQGAVARRIALQLLATGAMVVALLLVRSNIGFLLAGGTVAKLAAIAVLVGIGLAVYGAVAWVIGAVDREQIMMLLRRKPADA